MGRTLTTLAAACAVANAGTASAFVPPSRSLAASGRSRFVPARASTSTVQSARLAGARGLKALVDPGLASGVDPAWLHSVFTGIADAAGTVLDGTGLGADAVSGAADAAGAAVDAAAQGGGGLNLNPVELLTGLTEASITGLHDMLLGLGVPSPYGLSIIAFTLFVKAITFPLTYQQLSSTTKMQTLAPKVKELQARYANNPEAANQAIQQLYATEEVNPLAGCLPALAQIPIFISLYRSLLNLAKANKLTESFLWIPSLEGPTFDAPPTETLNWIKDWTDGAPKLGWHDTLAYLTIPLILVLTQSVSMKLTQAPKDPKAPVDDASAASQNVLKILPLMIGWFSLSVPSALGLYWILNNFVSTGSMVFIKNKIASETGNPSAKAKLSLPFMDTEEPEVMTMPLPPPESLPNMGVEEAKGFAPGTDEDVLEGEIVNESGTPVVVGSSDQPKPKSSKKKRKKRAGRK